MIQKGIILLLGITWVCRVHAQYHETIRTGRPGQAIGPYTVGKNMLQFQQGADFSKTVEAGLVTRTFQQNNVVRMGFTRTFELSAVFNYQYDDMKQGIFNWTHDGIQNVQFGARYNVIDEPKGIIPGIGYQVRIKFPAGAEVYRPANPGVVMILGTTNKINPDVSLTSNWIMTLNGNSPIPDYNYVFNLSFPLFSRLGGFVEHYAGFGNGRFIPQVDGGLSWLLTNDVQFDLYGGFDLKDHYQNSFVSAGISWRVPTKR